MDLSNPFFKLISDVMTEEAEKAGYTVVSVDGSNDPGKQNSQLTDFVAQGVAAIFLNPVDSKSAGEGVKKAHAAGIPVFTFDVQVTDPEATEMITSHIGSDNFQGGQLAGESMMKATGDTGKIAIISYPEVTSCILRVDGFKDYLKKNNSKLTIVTELSGKGNRNDGYTVGTDLLQAHPDIVGIFAINDPSGLGAYAAVLKAGKADTIAIVAFDASPAGKKAVSEKKLYDSPQQFPREMAKGTVAAFIKYLDGETVEKKIFIPCSHYDHAAAVAEKK
ncbi:substrate-binding domain-containing protein [bacterium]|nr:substrate-binding domain-containing protein [bacterium]